MIEPPRVAWRGVGVVCLGLLALLAATADGYGYHRDELYFRMIGARPALGYVDEPALTPLLARGSTVLFGDSPAALRVPAMLCALAVVVLTALLARELGGGTGAQVLAAAGVSGTFVLVIGHVLLTASVDLVVWLAVILFAARALLRRRPRWWLGAGLAVGLGLYNKQLVVLLLIGIAAGLLIAGPRRELAGPYLWGGVAIAVLLGAPNLVYQATHGWPELTMSRVIARDKGHDDRVFFLPLQVVLLGLPLVPIWIAGLVRLLRYPALRAVRALAWAYPVVAALVLVTGGQAYYTFGLICFLYAAGSVVTARWFAGRTGRRAWVLLAVAVNLALAAVIALPLIPVGSLGGTPVPAINQAARDTVGWPAYVRQAAEAYRALPAADRSGAVLLAENYGEAGALDRYRLRYGSPDVYSGQNELYNFGPPPESARVVVAVGFDMSFVAAEFASCTQVGALDNGVGVDNEEQGRPVAVCREPNRPWRLLWPEFQHYG